MNNLIPAATLLEDEDYTALVSEDQMGIRPSSSPSAQRPPKYAKTSKRTGKQPLERKEIQRRYRERLKQQCETANGMADEIASQCAQLSKEYQALKSHAEALQICLAYADELAAVLARCQLNHPTGSFPNYNVVQTVFSIMREGKVCPKSLIK